MLVYSMHVLQGSVAMRFWCGGILKSRFYRKFSRDSASRCRKFENPSRIDKVIDWVWCTSFFWDLV